MPSFAFYERIFPTRHFQLQRSRGISEGRYWANYGIIKTKPGLGEYTPIEKVTLELETKKFSWEYILHVAGEIDH